MMTKQNGFTLIEAVITIAIIGILAAIAIPAYETQKRKGYRHDAINALTEMAIRQERWYSKEGKYTGNIANIYGGGTTTELGKYNLSITFDTAAPEEYSLEATATGTQKEDANCFKLTLNHLGQKLAYNDTNALSDTNCWSK